jgi:hypothetical protein
MVKKTDELIDPHVSSNQSKLAVTALLKHTLKRKSDQEQNELTVCLAYPGGQKGEETGSV